jgi:O-acetyl-ADP-ribose deacetylase (regulator of RNase III)
MPEIAVGASRLTLERGDITRLRRHVGAIVNAANESLMAGGGVCGAIHRAGGRSIHEECYRIGQCETGSAVATTAGFLDADAVIHAVGPVWHGGGQDEERLLTSAYATSLKVAEERGLTSVAFPSISTGIYGFPIERAAAIAIDTVAGVLERGSTIAEVILVQFSDVDYGVYSAALDRWQAGQP